MEIDPALFDQTETTVSDVQNPPWAGGPTPGVLPKPTAGKPGNPRWYKGMPTSPNPAGRPKGQTQQTKLMQRMLDGADQIVEAVMEKAREGDSASANIVLGRILPALRSQSEKVRFDLDTAAPIARQVEQVLAAIADASIAPDVGKQVIEALAALSSVRATDELEERLAALEERHL